MGACLSIQVLGSLRGGGFSPCPLQPCSYFQADQVAVGSRAWSVPALVLRDSSVSPRHALIVKEGLGWVVQDMDSDNGIRSLPSIPATGPGQGPAQQAFRFEFTEELYCCFGAL